MNATQIIRRATLLAATAAVLASCTVTSVKADGTTDEPVWPKWDSTSLNHKRGTFPNLSSLSEVKAGMTKDQLYYLLGRPHYGGSWRPAEWNYLFHFNTPGQGSDDVTTCQFKVLFDKNMNTSSFYWNAVDPASGTCPPPAGPPPAPQAQRYTLGTDALFDFDRSDLSSQGREDLDKLSTELKKFDQLNSIRITGHTDYLGNDAYNQRLSQQRAETVRQYLVNQGLPTDKVQAVGMGEREPVKQCTATANRNALIACLQPNRRVEVQVDGSGQR